MSQTYLISNTKYFIPVYFCKYQYVSVVSTQLGGSGLAQKLRGNELVLKITELRVKD